MSTPSKTLSSARRLGGRAGAGLGALGRLYHPRTLREKGLLWSLGLGLVSLLVLLTVLAAFWSREPERFDVPLRTLQAARGDETRLASGAATATAIIGVAETLLHKSGGYLSNDVTPPSLLLDNMPNWEFGVITELRETVRALRNDFSRAQTQSAEDPDLMRADVQFHFDHQSWILPATEEEYAKGIAALEGYRARLLNGRAQFHARTDNLNAYLAVVEKRLGNLAHRLSANVRELRFADRPVDPASGEVVESTPWLLIDDVFFEARGYTWALLHVLQGIEQDFQPILRVKNAETLLRRIIHKLENSLLTVWSPMILNNSGYGVLTNHSLVMASYLSRANAAIIDLRLLLAQG